jgi:hypothetical protein
MAKYKYETPFDRMNRENREDERRASIASESKKRVTKNKPGAPYYQPQDEASDKAQIRADAQGAYMKSQVGDDYQRDEGIFADTARSLKGVMQGKIGKNSVMTYGDPDLMHGAQKAGEEAVKSQSDAEFKRESRGRAEYKKGGMTASSRADGCATKGKTKGRFV